MLKWDREQSQTRAIDPKEHSFYKMGYNDGFRAGQREWMEYLAKEKSIEVPTIQIRCPMSEGMERLEQENAGLKAAVEVTEKAHELSIQENFDQLDQMKRMEKALQVARKALVHSGVVCPDCQVINEIDDLLYYKKTKG